jgi:hypothetical protein
MTVHFIGGPLDGAIEEKDYSPPILTMPNGCYRKCIPTDKAIHDAELMMDQFKEETEEEMFYRWCVNK